MAFVRDERVRVVAPDDRSAVTLPLRVRWTVHDFAVTGTDGTRSAERGYFAVFVDRAPIPPGETVEWLARDDAPCPDSGCVDQKYLRDRHIYTTEKTSLLLDQLPAIQERGGVERHEVVIALLDGTGRRIGESAFYVRFNYEREE